MKMHFSVDKAIGIAYTVVMIMSDLLNHFGLETVKMKSLN